MRRLLFCTVCLLIGNSARPQDSDPPPFVGPVIEEPGPEIEEAYAEAAPSCSDTGIMVEAEEPEAESPCNPEAEDSPTACLAAGLEALQQHLEEQAAPAKPPG